MIARSLRFPLSRSRQRAPRDATGAAAVEFALVVMILLVIVLAIVQFSIYFWSYQVASHAAREGARRWAVDPCGGGNTALVQSRVGSAAAGGVSVGAAFSGGSPPESGDEVTVTVSFAVHELAGGMIPLPSSVTKRATARVEDVEECG